MENSSRQETQCSRSRLDLKYREPDYSNRAGVGISEANSEESLDSYRLWLVGE